MASVTANSRMLFAFSRDGKRIVTGAIDRTAVVWDISAPLAAVGSAIPAPSQIANFNVHHSPVRSVAFNPDATRVVLSCVDEIAEVWDVSTSKQLNLLRGHQGPLNAACYSPDGTRILTASKDGTARICQMNCRKNLQIAKMPIFVQCRAEGHCQAAWDSLFCGMKIWAEEHLLLTRMESAGQSCRSAHFGSCVAGPATGELQTTHLAPASWSENIFKIL